MTWLKIDDGFTQHPKLAGWTPAQKWSWLEVLTYCARYQTGGRIPDDLSLLPRSVTTSLLARAEQSGLVDRADDGGKVVHDWPIYNAATVAEKVAYYLAKHPDATGNEVVKAIGGTREIVLAEVKTQREGGTKAGSETSSATGTAEPEPEPGVGGSESGSESGTHAREPVQSSPSTDTSTSNRSEVPREVTTPRNGTLDIKSELLLTELLAWIGPDADTRTAAVVRHALSQATEAARVELRESLATAKPRHRAKYVVGTLKVATARARSAA